MMINTTSIEDLLSFVKTDNEPSPDLMNASSAIGKTRLKILSKRLLWWMKVQKTKDTLIPLELNSAHQWAQELSRLIETQGFLKGLISLDHGAVVFSPDLPSGEREKILSLVHTQYNFQIRRKENDKDSAEGNP